MSFSEIMAKGGVAMWPLLILSILTVGTIIERLWFWLTILPKQKEIFDKIMDTALNNWEMAGQRARYYRSHPLANFVHIPLQLSNPEPEMFHLALESAADEELAAMRRGDKFLETVIAISPLLGLLGTVLGLINSLRSIQLANLTTASTDGVTLGISEALISTATGLIVAIIALAFYRLFQAFWFNQVRIFRKVASELEMIYRQKLLDSEDDYDSPANEEQLHTKK